MTDVIASFKGKAGKRKCGNPPCSVGDLEAKLKVCARCKGQAYCSRECQTRHWPKHKSACNANASITSELAAADATGNKYYGIPDGLTLVKLHENLIKWSRFHVHLIMTATVHALELPRDLNRARTHFLHLQIRYRGDDRGINAKAFEFLEATVVSMDSASKWGVKWHRAVEQLKEIQEESDENRCGTEAFLILECQPLSLQISSLGSLTKMDNLKIQTQWKHILRRHIEDGTRFDCFQPD